MLALKRLAWINISASDHEEKMLSKPDFCMGPSIKDIRFWVGVGFQKSDIAMLKQSLQKGIIGYGQRLQKFQKFQKKF